MSNKIVPTISSGTPGPLGVLHLPRFWQKLSLGAAGKLAEDYPACGQGYDQMVLDGLGLDKQALLDFVAEKKPTYIQFEKFVSENATKLNQTAVSQLNAAITGYQHTDETRQSILSSVGLPDGNPTDAVNLNNLDDWQGFHAAEIA
ncbi:DUF5069 domain-containing protein [Luteolibacter algae]|uniref:DUF5069 domain-containing protein n=1 Tax=Luteolibacter algae TaxID=454151 RepID=A0ABW5DDV3_9BACT